MSLGDGQCKEFPKYTAEVKAVMEDCPMNCCAMMAVIEMHPFKS